MLKHSNMGIWQPLRKWKVFSLAEVWLHSKVCIFVFLIVVHINTIKRHSAYSSTTTENPKYKKEKEKKKSHDWMQELQDSTSPLCCWALFHRAICNLKTCLLPFIMKKKTREWSLKIQPASNRCRCSPDGPQRYRSVSLSGHTHRHISEWPLTLENY